MPAQDVQSRLRLVQDTKDGKPALHRESKKPQAAAMNGNQQCATGVSISYPLHLRTTPPSGNLHAALCCQHVSQCVVECKCAESKLHVTKVPQWAFYWLRLIACIL